MAFISLTSIKPSSRIQRNVWLKSMLRIKDYQLSRSLSQVPQLAHLRALFQPMVHLPLRYLSVRLCRIWMLQLGYWMAQENARKQPSPSLSANLHRRPSFSFLDVWDMFYYPSWLEEISVSH